MEGLAFLKGLISEPWQIMAEIDLFVMAFKLGFPIALLEAMWLVWLLIALARAS